MNENITSPPVQMLLSAILFVIMPVTVFFFVQGKIQTDLTSNMKSSTSEAISAIAAIITAHIFIGYFLYSAFKYDKIKIRTD